MVTTPTAEYRLNADGSIDLYIDGEVALRVGETVSIPPLPTKKLQLRVMAELGDAMRRGAAHGRCDRQREMTNALNGQSAPGHVYYDAWSQETPGEHGLYRRIDGQETRLLADIPIRPQYLMGNIINELDRAFRVGGLYGADGAPVVHLTRVVGGSEEVTGGFVHHDLITGAPVPQYGWFASAFCTCGKLQHTDTDLVAARHAAAAHREEMQAAGHLVGIDR